MVQGIPGKWYPDPTMRNELRYWDGQQWTEHVVSDQVLGIDPFFKEEPSTLLPPKIAGFLEGQRKWKIGRQVRKAGVDPRGWQGGGTLLTEAILVVNQKPQRREKYVEYTILAPNGRHLGEAREVRTRSRRKALGIPRLSKRHQILEVVDHNNALVYILNKPPKTFKRSVELYQGDGTLLGTFSEKRFFSSTITLESGDVVLGYIDRENSHNFEFEVYDAFKREIASVSRTWVGKRTASKTRADNYVVHIKDPTLVNPALGLVVTSAVVIDLLFEQGAPSKAKAEQERQARKRYGA